MLFAWRPIWTSRRARGASSPRLYGCDEFVRSLRSLQNKKFLDPNSRAQKERLSPKHARPSRRRRRESTQTRKQKKKMSNDDRACASIFVAVLFDSFATTIPLSRCVYRRPKDGGGECVCVWISVKISPFATPVFFYPQSIAL